MLHVCMILFALSVLQITTCTHFNFDNAHLAAALIERLNSTTTELGVVKTATSKRVRLVFVAGLEGTGHHAWNAIFGKCVVSGKCAPATNLTQSLMQLEPKQGVVHGLFGAEDAPVNSIQLHDVYKQMEYLAEQDEARIYVVGLCFVHRSAMLSYPNYNGANKALDHPDIAVLATLAEMAGLDLRVIVLQRSAREILTSTANRDIGRHLEPKILIDNAAALYTQLLLLDRSFYQCVQYRELGKLSGPRRHALAKFIHPTLAPPIMATMLSAVHYGGSSTYNNTEANATISNSSPASNCSYSRRMEAKLQAHRSRVASEAAGKSASQLAAEESSARYHEFVLEQRLRLIDSLCSQT